MSAYSLSVALEDAVYEVDYKVTHEGCGPSGYAFDGSADAGEPLEFHIVTVNGSQAKDVPVSLMEAIEDFIHEHHEPDDGDPDWDRGWDDDR